MGRKLAKTGCIRTGSLLAWIFLGANVFAQPALPGNGSTANTNDSLSDIAPDYGTNLWLSISLSNYTVELLLHNTQPGVPYVIRSRTNLVSGWWLSETEVTGAVAATTTPAVLRAAERTNNLFIQVLTWVTNATSAITAMAAIGGERILALTTNGDVVSWGGNLFGELGDYTSLDSTNPVHIAGLARAISVASGLYHAVALDLNGTVWAWGQNDFGQLGNDDAANAALPVQVPGMTNVIAIAAHGFNGEGVFGLSSAVKADGTVWIWGQSECISDGGYAPMPIAGISNAIAVAIGDCHGLALLTNGTIWMWGNGFGTPVPISGLSNVVAICAGNAYSLALASNGTVWAWGQNDYGQLGDGAAEYHRDTPAMVVGLTNVIGIAAGARHCLAVDADGRLWGWGNDYGAQLGDGGLAGICSQPFQIVGVSNIVSIAAGVDGSAALDRNANLWQWGATSEGPITVWGDENGLPRLAPTYVDFYNGQLPQLQILSGNHQTPHAGLEFPQTLVFMVTDTGGVALSNAPVSVEVISGDMQLRTAHDGEGYKGLRVKTDAEGEVALIGYADRYASVTNCLIRVLAASREQIVEADFDEALILPPVINITSPQYGETILVSSNQGLTITVEAEAAAGATIQKVDYSSQAIGGEQTMLGSSTQSPYSFTWTDNTWWSNAFVGRYNITAVAVDDTGVESDPQSVDITVALDSDGVGIPDFWQLQFFGQLGVDPGADSDGDGISNLDEFQQGTDPTDFYNGRLPYLEMLGGNDQTGNYGLFLPAPLSIRVAGSEMLNTFIANAPVTFTVTKGTVLLAATTNDTPGSSLALRSDANGRVSAYVYFPSSSSNPPDSTILVNAFSGTNSVNLTAKEFIPLARWRFDDTNTWIGEQGQLPLSTSNLAGVSNWGGHAVSVSDDNPAWLVYPVVETDGHTNINCQTGSLLFWFKPDWTSASAGGNGPGVWARLIEMGNNEPASYAGWWSLYLSPDGSQLFFATADNSGSMTNLSAGISWYSNEWYQIALTYSPAGSALYVDGQLLANGAGVTLCPNAGELADGFRIGSDRNGDNQAGGAYDELEIFAYPLAAADTVTCASQIPDWWNIKFFNQADIDPDFQPDNDGFTLFIDYLRDRYPDVINFSVAATNSYVTNPIVPVQIHLEGGVPFGMAVAVITTNFVVVPNQLFDVGSNFIGTPWQPHDSNTVASLTAGDGDYYVWVGLRGLPHDAPQTWRGTRLTLDTAPPILTITNPAGSVAAKPIIQLQGCANESLSSLTYDVSNATGVVTNQTAYVTGHFCDANLLAITTNYFQCCNVMLTSNGINLITLHATDLAGNTTSTDFSFTFDVSTNANPPALTILWPQNGTYIGGSNFTLQAQVSDPMTAVVASFVDADGHRNSVEGLVEQNGSVWVQGLPLAGGTTVLTVTATDSAGNSSVTNLILFQSGIIVTMNPPTGDQLNQPSVNVSGTVSDSSYTPTINGVAATVSPDGTWAADNVPASSSGTAMFDVEVYAGSVPELARANGGFVPRDAPTGGAAGSQLFTVALPVKVGLMSFLGHSSACGVVAGGRYAAVNPCCGVAFANNEDTVNWNYQGGGMEAGYDYGSGYYNGPPGSPSWMMLCPPKSIAWANPLPAGEDAYGAPWGNVSDVQSFFRTHVMIEPQGQTPAGSTATYLVHAQVWDVNGRGLLAPDLVSIRGKTLSDDGQGSGYIIFTAPAGENVDVTPKAAGNYTFNVQAAELNVKLAVDNNRDGQITFDNRDVTTPMKPYHFWINDSKEHGDDETSGASDDQIPGQPALTYSTGGPTPCANFAYSHVRGRSDLVNFFPVALCLGNALQSLPPSDGYEYHLYQIDTEAHDAAVKFAYTDLTPDSAYNYLTGDGSIGYGTDLSKAAMDADTISINAAAILDANWLTYVNNNGGTGIILLEGCAATPHPLMLEIWHNGKLMTGIPLYLSFSGVEQMFRHVNLSYVNGEIEVPPRNEAPNEPSSSDMNFVFLHGYNVNQQQARGTESEIFKRMYWSGSKAKFYGVTWNGAMSQGDYIADVSCNFQTNVVNAFQSASHFADFLGTMSADKTVVASHSLGNMVVLCAISDYNATMNKYFMIDAAVPVEALQGSSPFEPAMIPSAWQTYSDRTFASSWWQLFADFDGRSALTWSNRLGNLGDVDIYNFYSPGEEVLRQDDEDPPPGVLNGGLTQLLNYWAGVPFGTYVWVWQEKGKGNAHFDNFISSTHGGWRFPANQYGDPIPIPPSTANGLPASILRQVPVFDFGSRFDPIEGPFPDLVLTNAVDGNAYAQANRDRILSDAIPALTLAAGANFVPIFDERYASKRNFNMQNEFQTGWPASRFNSGERNNNWHHSDYNYVAYPFTHKLFDDIVNDGNLK